MSERITALSSRPLEQKKGISANPERELPGMEKIRQARETFENEYGEFLAMVAKSVNMPVAQIFQQIALESKFRADAQLGGAQGHMQLKPVPVRDIQNRFPSYAPLIQQLDADFLPKNVPLQLKKLVEMADSFQRKIPGNLGQVISNLVNIRKNPFVNLVVGIVYGRFLEDRTREQVRRSGTEDIKKTLDSIGKNTEFVKGIHLKIRETGVVLSPEQVVDYTEKIRNSEDLQIRFEALRKYNNSSLKKYGVPMRDFYATTVLVGALAREDQTPNAPKGLPSTSAPYDQMARLPVDSRLASEESVDIDLSAFG